MVVVRRSRLVRFAALLLSLTLLAAGCGGDDDEGGGGGGSAEGGEETTQGLVIARSMDINSLDPQRAYCDTCQIYMTAVYETLVGLDLDNESLVPRLAEEWSSNDDQTEFTFQLDPDATFASGAPVTSEDVKFSWERQKGLAGSASYLAGAIESIDTPDERTVVVTLGAPNSAFLNQVNSPYMGVVEQALAEENGATTDPTSDAAEEWFLGNSAGSGPWVLEGYTEGEELRLARNDEYWGEDGADYPSVVIRQTDDAVTQRQQLEQGAVDIAMQLSTDVVKDMDEGGLSIEKVPSFNYVYLALSPGAAGGEALTPEVREAIRLALDYDGLVDVTVGGAGRAQPSPIPNGFLGTDDLEEPAQDVDAATELLAGKKISLDATYPTLNVYGVDFSTAMQKVQTDLKAVGIDLQLNPVEISVWAEKISTDGIPVTALYFAPDHTDPSQYVQYFGLVPGSQWQTWTKVDPDPEQESALGEAMAAGDDDEKAELYAGLAEAMIEDGLIIPLVNPDLYLASSDRIDGMHYSACCNLYLNMLSPAE